MTTQARFWVPDRSRRRVDLGAMVGLTQQVPYPPDGPDRQGGPEPRAHEVDDLTVIAARLSQLLT